MCKRESKIYETYWQDLRQMKPNSISRSLIHHPAFIIQTTIMKQLFNTRTASKGIFLGLGFCLYTTLMWLTQLDTTYLRYGQYIDIAIVLWPIAMICWAVKSEMDHYRVSVGQRIVIAVLMGCIAYVIYNPFLYTYHHFINPNWYASVLQLEEEKMRLASLPEIQIHAQLTKMGQSSVANPGLFQFSTFLASAVIVPVLSALLSMIFVRNSRLKSGA